jgi:hypothetical protein
VFGNPWIAGTDDAKGLCAALKRPVVPSCMRCYVRSNESIALNVAVAKWVLQG